MEKKREKAMIEYSERCRTGETGRDKKALFKTNMYK